MNKLQEKLDFLLEKYSVETKAILKNKNTVAIDGADVPLLSHRSERRFTELKNIAQGGTLSGISVMRVARIVTKGTDLYEVLKREYDLCRYILGDEIKSVMAMDNGNVINVIAKTSKGIVCTIEVSATLADGAKPIDKHEIIAERGTACDVVVDAQLKQDSVYVYGSDEKKYTDVDFELYGLSIEEIAIVRAAFAVAQNKSAETNISEAQVLETLAEATKKSLENCERVVL